MVVWILVIVNGLEASKVSYIAYRPENGFAQYKEELALVGRAYS